MSGVQNNGGPCGACKFMRRKCVTGCVFAPYFDSDHGTAHFEAVHKVFGASNASKMLARLPINKRLDAVVTLCYEALARVRDPVYGCVAHIFTLRQQVLNLQAELAYIQARLSTLKRLPLPPHRTPSPSQAANIETSSELASTSNISIKFDDPLQSEFGTGSFAFTAASPGTIQQEFEDDDLQMLAQELVTRYLPVGPRMLKPFTSH